MNRMSRILIGMMLLAQTLFADTLTVKSSAVDLNGDVTYDGHTFEIVAKYENSERTLHFPPKDIEKILLNDRSFNTGQPNTVQSFPDSLGHPMQHEGCKVSVLFVNGSKSEATLIRITSTNVLLRGKHGHVKRTTIQAIWVK